MGVGPRIQRTWKAAALLAVGAAGGGAALAVASVPDSNGVIHACYGIDGSGKPTTDTNANLRIIDPSAGQTCFTTGSPGAPPIEANLSWNTIGVRGPRGPQGVAGKSVTVAGGNTLTLAGGDVVTVGTPQAVTISTPPLTSSSRVIGTVALNLGTGRPVSFNLYSWTLPGAQGSGGNTGTGRASVKELVLTKTTDKASPTLFKYCANGKHIPTATITLRKAGGGQKEYLKITLSQVFVSSFQTDSSKGTENPTESVSLNFSKIKYDYKQQ